MKELKIICRRERLQGLVTALREAGVPRLTVTHVHVVGSGVDPEHYHLSMDEGTAYTEKAKVELACRAGEVARLLAIVHENASTGERGDGVVFVTEIEQVVSIRTGDQDALALL